MSYAERVATVSSQRVQTTGQAHRRILESLSETDLARYKAVALKELGRMDATPSRSRWGIKTTSPGSN
jgi:hypothetical protein